jgi:uncharacterized protein YoxC
MGWPLQLALFCASVAVVVFVVCFLVALVALRRQAAQWTRALGELQVQVQLVLAESRRLMDSVNELARRLNRQSNDVDEVIQTVRGWTARTNRLVEGVGAVLEPPLRAAVRNVGVFRRGLTVFFETFFNHRSP